MAKTSTYTQEEMIDSVEKALKTWYPVDHPLRFDLMPSGMGLFGEVGELVEALKKSRYKLGFSHEEAIPAIMTELGDIWYYLRVICFQITLAPKTKTMKEAQPLRCITGNYDFVDSSYSDIVNFPLARLGESAAKLQGMAYVYGPNFWRMRIDEEIGIRQALVIALNSWAIIAKHYLNISLGNHLSLHPANYYTESNWDKLKGGAHGWSEEAVTLTSSERKTLFESLWPIDES